MAIYDYGVGRTYATPQAAFDACQVANESGGAAVPFIETNYVRGYGDAVFPAAAVGEPVLRLVHSATGRGVEPTRAFPLVIDGNGTDEITLEDTEGVGAIVGGKSDGTVLTSFVRIEVDVRSAASHTIIVNPAAAGGQECEDWTVNGDMDAALAAIVVGGLRNLRVGGKLTAGTNGCIYNDGGDGIYGIFKGVLLLANSVLRAAGSAVNIYFCNLLIEMFHNSAETVGDILTLTDEASDFIALTACNNIFDSDGKFVTIDADLHVPYSDGNCFNLGGALADLNGTAIADLAAWRTETGQDPHSIEADPLFSDTSLQIPTTSPCVQQGRAIPNAGVEGTERSLTLDQGAYQVTDPASVKATYSGGRLRIRVDGGAPVDGL